VDTCIIMEDRMRPLILGGGLKVLVKNPLNQRKEVMRAKLCSRRHLKVSRGRQAYTSVNKHSGALIGLLMKKSGELRNNSPRDENNEDFREKMRPTAVRGVAGMKQRDQEGRTKRGGGSMDTAEGGVPWQRTLVEEGRGTKTTLTFSHILSVGDRSGRWREH